MIFSSWSIALSICTVTGLFLCMRASVTAVKILRLWDVGSDSALQIELEGETLLSATLVQYGLVLQILSLVLLVLAADAFSGSLVGAMCATGAFLANDYGIPALLVKLLAVFFYGFWIVLHRLDICSEFYPLVRIKNIYLLSLLPLMLTDTLLQTGYLLGLDPDIITSCCGTLFREGQGDGYNLLGPLPLPGLLTLFSGLVILISLGSWYLSRGLRQQPVTGGVETLSIALVLLWTSFFPLALVVITVFISSYIYNMPFHNCPFDILKREYYGIGYPIYGSLMVAVFTGICGSGAVFLRPCAGLRSVVVLFQRTSLRLSLLSLLVFLVFISAPPCVYFYFGGEM